MAFMVFLLALHLAGGWAFLDVHFENVESGFFLKHGVITKSDWTELGNNQLDDSAIFGIDRFTVVQNAHPMSMKAAYGPFATKQSVPARYIVPDGPPSGLSNGKPPNNTEEDRHLDVSAHLVNQEVARDVPVLRVLFHTGVQNRLRQQPVCIVLHVTSSWSNKSGPILASCTPSVEDNYCLTEATIPSDWWPTVHTFDSTPTKVFKTPQRLVHLSYYVLEPKWYDGVSADKNAGMGKCAPPLQIQPLTKIASIPLTNSRYGFKELKTDDRLFMILPTGPIYPRSKFYIPVYFRVDPRNSIVGFVIKARVKKSLSIVDAECRSMELWDLKSVVNTKGNSATVVVHFKQSQNLAEVAKFYNRSVYDDQSFPFYNKNQLESRVEEVFSWLIEVDSESKGSEIWNEEAKIVWFVHYITIPTNQGKKTSTSVNSQVNDTSSESAKVINKNQLGNVKHKISTKFEIHKDITQAVLPVSKSPELINTALLTGKQVSQPMRIFVVSQSGRISDVTRQSTCHTEDDSVLKVTSSCSSVFVDGSEIRGSSNATILVKYETFTGLARFLVWMPELTEMDILMSDSILNQIYDWVIPVSDDTVKASDMKSRRSIAEEKTPKEFDDKRYSQPSLLGMDYVPETDIDEDDFEDEEYDDDVHKLGIDFEFADKNKMSNIANSVCQMKYQQATIDVYARFKAADYETGHVRYLINSKTWLKVTDLVLKNLRVADHRIANIKKRILFGRQVGRTEVQVVSPLSGRVYTSKEVRVVNDKVSITKLLVNVISGMQLNVVPDASAENIYIAETYITRRLTAKYQEGLLDVNIEFSDGTVTSVADVEPAEYAIAVDSLSPDVVAFAPMLRTPYPRVIAVGPGNGHLLRVAIMVADTCRDRATIVSATAYVDVRVPATVNNVQNDGFGRFPGFEKPANAYMQDESFKTSGISEIRSSVDGMLNEQAKSDNTDSSANRPLQMRRGQGTGGYRLGPSEFGFYLILASFSFAIIVFVVSCIIYATRTKTHNTDCGGTNHELLDYSAPRKRLFNSGYKPVSGTAPSNVSSHKSKDPPTTNVHDWVWLGRATLERASGLLVPASAKFRRSAKPPSAPGSPVPIPKIRITNNPTFKVPDVLATTAVESSNGMKLPSKPVIDSTTYCKRGQGQMRFSTNQNHAEPFDRFGTRSDCQPPPPPVPQHAKPLDDKPPVPPHRNIGVTASIKPIPEVSVAAPHRHKHHHHHHHHRHRSHKSASLEPEYQTGTYTKPATFVRPAEENAAEVRQANIVGNPMFSGRNEEEQSANTLEDLNLGMNYQQIMEYFSNLKESNA